MAESGDLETGLAYLERLRVPGFLITAVDTTGAGDAFAGAFLTLRYVDQRELADAVRLANAVAADSCTRLGARSGPNRAGLASFLDDTSKVER